MGQIQPGQNLYDQIAKAVGLGDQDSRVKIYFSNNKYFSILDLS